MRLGLGLTVRYSAVGVDPPCSFCEVHVIAFDEEKDNGADGEDESREQAQQPRLGGRSATKRQG